MDVVDVKILTTRRQYIKWLSFRLTFEKKNDFLMKQ